MKTSNYIKHTQSKGIRKLLIDRFNKKLLSVFSKSVENMQNILDLGCGEAFTLNMLQSNFPNLNYFGYDINPIALNLAKQNASNAKLEIQDIYTLKSEHEFDIIICCEVLEHLQKPLKALKNIAKLNAKIYIFSVPNEPFFKLGNFFSGKYIKNLGNHPEHIQNFSKRQFYKMCSEYFSPIILTSSFPWTIFVGAAK
ncbi:MAG: class I SAM-dependent methyltransferase [Fibromonadaceae bacterium]|jgi:2-polyprenyl-3-methyl-5-hydroxy-6-metoxy-1,4-benzoquinol methylase|nr:class I SAM-dependent methyltransferase [Fibromonadaceae bacterium]